MILRNLPSQFSHFINIKRTYDALINTSKKINLKIFILW